MTDLRALRKPSSTQLLARILETPDLAEQIQSLEAPVLGKLIDRVGLEDAGELVAFATTEQLAEIFDEDLWRSERPGEDERFDAERFLVWLEIMLEAGDAFVANKLASLPEDLVTLAFHRQVLVIRLEDLMAEMEPDEDGAIDKALASCLGEELDEYQLVSRHHEGWDSVLAALLALDRDHHGHLVGILERCAHMSREQIDDSGGLCEVLSSAEMFENDVAADREDRRAEAGHVAPSAAAAFLKLARGAIEAPRDETPRERDPLTRAYFRELRKTQAPPKALPSVDGKRDEGLLTVLRASGIAAPIASPPLLTGAASDEPIFSAAMRSLAEDHPKELAERSEEIAYLANVLVAGASFEKRRLRPVEAVRAALAIVGLGHELALGDRPSTDVTEPLRMLTADALFRRAYGYLAVEIVAPAADALRKRGEYDVADRDAIFGLKDDCPHFAGTLGAAFVQTRGEGARFIATLADVRRAKGFLSELAARPRRSPVAEDGAVSSLRRQRKRPTL